MGIKLHDGARAPRPPPDVSVIEGQQPPGPGGGLDSRAERDGVADTSVRIGKRELAGGVPVGGIGGKEWLRRRKGMLLGGLSIAMQETSPETSPTSDVTLKSSLDISEREVERDRYCITDEGEGTDSDTATHGSLMATTPPVQVLGYREPGGQLSAWLQANKPPRRWSTSPLGHRGEIGATAMQAFCEERKSQRFKQKQVEIMHTVSVPSLRPLVGSFEESVLSGRLAQASPYRSRIEGFTAMLTVTGGGMSSSMSKLNFSAVCVDGISGGTPGPYCANIGLHVAPNVGSGPVVGNGSFRLESAFERKLALVAQSPHTDSAAHLKSVSADICNDRIRVPLSGQVQLVLTNPEKTPIHTFICRYDLQDMPPFSKTFLRQKIFTVYSTSFTSAGPASGGSGPPSSRSLRCAIHLRFCCLPSKKAVKEQRRRRQREREREWLAMRGREDDGEESDAPPVLLHHSGGDYTSDDLHISDGESAKPRSQARKGKKRASKKEVPGDAADIQEGGGEDGAGLGAGGEADASGRGKGDKDDKRRLFLYGDIRVVFPQRWEDEVMGREKTMVVEYETPTDPKYFQLSPEHWCF